MKTKVITYTNKEEISKMSEQIKEKQQMSPVRPLDINEGINENKTKDITIKKQHPIKKITQIHPIPIITSNKFEDLEEIKIGNKIHRHQNKPK